MAKRLDELVLVIQIVTQRLYLSDINSSIQDRMTRGQWMITIYLGGLKLNQAHPRYFHLSTVGTRQHEKMS